MTLPAETKFPCADGTGAEVLFDFDCNSGVHGDGIKMVYVEIDGGDFGLFGCHLDREQAESLRDQLTQWLEVVK